MTTQNVFDFQPGLTVQYKTWRDMLVAAVYASRAGPSGVAGHLDMGTSELAKRLNQDGGIENRPLRVEDAIGIVEATGDMRPIYWLIERFLESKEFKQQRALDQFIALAPIFAELAEQGGIAKGKAKR
jgi:hypothetical protein